MGAALGLCFLIAAVTVAALFYVSVATDSSHTPPTRSLPEAEHVSPEIVSGSATTHVPAEADSGIKETRAAESLDAIDVFAHGWGTEELRFHAASVVPEAELSAVASATWTAVTSALGLTRAERSRIPKLDIYIVRGSYERACAYRRRGLEFDRERIELFRYSRGLYEPGWDFATVIGGGPDLWCSVAHETAHHVVHYGFPTCPFPIDEGIAMFYAERACMAVPAATGYLRSVRTQRCKSLAGSQETSQPTFAGFVHLSQQEFYAAGDRVNHDLSYILLEAMERTSPTMLRELRSAAVISGPTNARATCLASIANCPPLSDAWASSRWDWSQRRE